MSDQNLKTRLVDYYSHQAMSDADTARLTSLASFSENGGVARTAQAPSLRAGMGVGLAAAIGLAVGWWGHSAVVKKSVEAPTGTMPSEEFSRPTAPVRFVSDSTKLPDLVAVAVWADWCPACPLVVPVFDNLIKEYGDQPIQFVVLDITDPKTCKQAEYLAANLGLEWMSKKYFSRTGAIRLVSREKKTILASLTNPDQLSKMQSAIQDALP